MGVVRKNGGSSDITHIKIDDEYLDIHYKTIEKKIKKKFLKEIIDQLRKNDKHSRFKNNHDIEILYINNYTNSSIKINNLLRKNYEYLEGTDIKDLIINIVVLSQAIHKAKKEKIPFVIRYESVWSKSKHNQQIQNIKTDKNLYKTKAFISTSKLKEDNIPESFSSAKRCIIIKNPYGVDVSELSNFPDEQEFLMPPSMLYYSKTLEHNDKQYFIAKNVSSLDNFIKM